MSTLNNATDHELIEALERRGYALQIWSREDIVSALEDFSDLTDADIEIAASRFAESGKFRKWADQFDESDLQSLAEAVMDFFEAD